MGSVASGRCRLTALLLVTLFLAGCERPFVEERAPEIEVVAPDLSDVLLENRIALQVRATSFRPIDRVLVNGAAMTFDPAASTWEAGVTLERGLNLLIVDAFDIEGVRRRDTLFAVHMTYRVVGPAPSPRVPRAGHTVTMLSDGSLLLAGGVAHAGGQALQAAYRLAPGADRFVPLGATMRAPRTGHTATRLPDGRVLLLGGSRTDDLTAVTHLVEAAEVFDPATATFAEVPVVGAPIRRAFHTAVLRIEGGVPIVDLYGGRGDIRYGATPRLGTRDDLRGFAFRNDTLFALNPASGAPIGPLAGHTQTPLDARDEAAARYFLVLGSFFDGDFADPTSLLFDYRPGVGLLFEETGAPRVPRTLHAAVHLRPGFVLILGGRQGTGTAFVDTAELYVEPARRFFRLPALAIPSLQRTTFTATFLPPARILLTGGFAPGGIVLADAVFFEFDL
ncbi:hypothetical protein GQ464_016945 [Rhodocaloribacter litoris]|uniref:kelch repeat-containing protein n=1 Tax=Rhodocaloribacter litoris TaxID=2558931 RepID=UPI001E483359|nr:kelch repeat-containing protein [Rhodocaloribacter litoris]QXD15071.1 hypothetical protein GQ464_016945 [Rhodocaloribacter litoris]GIV62134.1 MAG: hypothetical protein KatS3mg044_1000 [Rhodothermaceae bacterium]